jgi:hypothetical protein
MKKKLVKKGPEWRASFALYRETDVCKSLPIPERLLKSFAYDLLDWAKNDPKALQLRSFWVYEGISSSTVALWAKKYPWLAEILTIAKEMIGCRREKGGINNTLNSQMVILTMPLYDPEIKELIKWKASIKEEFAGQDPTVIVKMEDFKSLIDKKESK